VTAQRLERFNANIKVNSRSAEKPAASRTTQCSAPGTHAIALLKDTSPTSLLGFLVQPFAPAQVVADRQFPWATPPTPFLAFLSGKTQSLAVGTHVAVTDQRLVDQRLVSSAIRTLVAGLVLVALLPILTLGAIFLLSTSHTPWSRPATHPSNESSVLAAQSASRPPVLSSPAMLEATAGGDITFPIALDGTDGVPALSIIAVRGLPQGSKLSSGRPYDETEWNVKPDEIGDLYLVLPRTASGEAKLLMQLVAPDGAIIADTATVLKMTSHSTANIGASDSKIEPKQAQVVDEPAEPRGTTGAEEPLANLEAAMATPGDPVPLPLRRPAQTSSDDANWITLTSVNLRERPTRSAPAIGVVAKGAKLHLIGRKRSWVQVTNLATSEEGWIYARHIATVR
jgi:hypothetical protein